MKSPSLLVAALLAVGCTSHEGTCAPEGVAVPDWDSSAVLPLYDPVDNPFAQPIGDDPAVHPESDTMVRSLVEQHTSQGMLVVSHEWSSTVVVADASAPRADVALTARWAPYDTLRDVPIPPWARPDPSDDGHLAILDLAAREEIDLWQACISDDGVSASWGNVVSLDGPGIFPTGLSARGSGFALLNGLVWPDELAAGHIDHALLFSYDHTASGGPVAPATESDGTEGNAEAIPEGARVQLDPTLDLDTLDLEPWQRTFARALQEYGMILGDDGGGISLYAVGPASFPDGAYDGLLPFEDGYSWFPDDFPVDRFRVLDFGPQDPDVEPTVEHPERFD